MKDNDKLIHFWVSGFFDHSSLWVSVRSFISTATVTTDNEDDYTALSEDEDNLDKSDRRSKVFTDMKTQISRNKGAVLTWSSGH